MRELFLAETRAVTRYTDISIPQLHEALSQSSGLFWLDIEQITDEDASLLREFGFHPLSIEDCGPTDTRPKIDEFPDHLFIVFRTLNGDPHDEIVETVKLCVFLSADFVVTVHPTPLPFLKHVKDRVEQDYRQMRTPSFCMYTVLDAAVDHFFPMMDQLDDRIDQVEDRILEQFEQAAIHELFALKKQVLFLRKITGPQREVMNTLTSRPYPQIHQETVIHLRDVYDHLVRIHDILEVHRDLLISALNAYLSQVNNSLNTVMKTLGVVATILLPLTFLTGVFGMNFTFIPGLHHPYGFIATMAGMGLLSLILIVVFKRKGWM